MPARQRDRGVGPFKRLVLRGATVIDGTGAPPIGPTDIVVENNRITLLKKVTGNLANAANRPPAGDHEIDCRGKWVTPGFIDCHAHAGVPNHAANGWVPPVDCVYKLWLAHGVTTVREMGSMNGLGWMLDQKKRSAENSIAAPRLLAYAYFPAVNDMLKVLHTPDEGRAWLRKLKERGADGVKFFGAPPAIMEAALDECAKLGLRSGCHHAQMSVTRMNALTTARWGLTSAEHYYGLPEALFEDRVVQNFPLDYDYNDEYFRFSVSGQMFKQGADARLGEMERGAGEIPRARLHVRADLHDLRCQSRPDARAAGRLAQGVHLEVDVGLLHAAARRTRLLLVSLVDPERDRVEGELSPLDGVHQRVQEPRRPRLHRQRIRASSIRSSASAIFASWSSCRRPAFIRSKSSARPRRRALPCAACRTSWARWRWASTPTCWCTTITR